MNLKVKEFYSQYIFRKLRFGAYIGKQITDAKLINNIKHLRDDKIWTFKKKTKCSAEEEEEEEEKEKEKEEEKEEEKPILIYQRVYGCICM